MDKATYYVGKKETINGGLSNDRINLRWMPWDCRKESGLVGRMGRIRRWMGCGSSMGRGRMNLIVTILVVVDNKPSCSGVKEIYNCVAVWLCMKYIWRCMNMNTTLWLRIEIENNSLDINHWLFPCYVVQNRLYSTFRNHKPLAWTSSTISP